MHGERCTSNAKPCSRSSATTSTTVTCSASTTLIAVAPTSMTSASSGRSSPTPSRSGFAQNKGHWADIGGSVPGSFDVTATEHFAEGLRITPVRIWHEGRFLADVAKLLVANTRAPEISLGDLHAQAEATGVCEREIQRLVAKYGRGTVVDAMAEVQDYVERIVRQRVAELPDGEWVTEDYLDSDPSKPEGWCRSE